MQQDNTFHLRHIINYVILDRPGKELEIDEKEALEGSVSDGELLERLPFEKDSKDVLDWINNAESFGELDQDADTSIMDQGEVGLELPEYPEYEKFIQGSVAYKDWLLSSIRGTGPIPTKIIQLATQDEPSKTATLGKDDL
ncbi:hypothetical protein N7468_006707 [Penicillium chermesinum]|uniref:Uncharacterized protein n=1 Tax=Penicillium chermesinum TaxID=63820 RepID=A0A9W9TJU2_9EURO|nr:uncharacterized protein N7468_006707 [Penicillium chermesinum]KAJ5225482.1 hypothetical protein N7468_006707 [Penicillium chermesinum]